MAQQRLIVLVGFLLIGLCSVAVTASSPRTRRDDPDNSDNGNSTEQPEKLLLDHLFRDYERIALPVTNPADTVRINISLTIMQIIDMDVKTQALTTNAWIQLEWNDELLRWKPEEYSGIRDLRLPSERIWTPDLELYNDADVEVTLRNGHTPVVIKHDGNASWIEPKEMHTTCPVDVRYFPFDRQSCKLQIGSWAHDGLKMSLEMDSEEVDLSSFRDVSDWTLIKASQKRTVNIYSCCPEPYIDIQFILEMERKPWHYVCNTIIPCVMISFITLLTLTLAPESVLRIGVQVVALIAFSHYMTELTNILPDTPKSRPLILIYLILMMTLTYSAIAFTFIILRLYKIGIGKDSTQLPNWFLRLILSGKGTSHQLPTVNTSTVGGPPGATFVDVTVTREDIPLTAYSFTEALGNNATDVPSSLPMGNSQQSGLPTQQTFNNRSDISTMNEGSQGNIYLAQFATKLDRIGLWFFAIAITLVNAMLLILPM